MSESTTTSTPASSGGFTFADALSILQALGTAAVLINPEIAGAAAAITGIGQAIATIVPKIQALHEKELTIARQQTIADAAAADRASVGAQPAAIN